MIWHISAALVAVALQLPFAAARRTPARVARGCRRIWRRFSTPDPAATSTSSSRARSEKIDRLAQRYRLHIKKPLSSGAVFTVSRQTLDALSQDREVETLSGNAAVHSHMALTTDVDGRRRGVVGRD